jgi:hypothetical protein
MSGQTELIANLFCSVGIRQPGCFGLCSITVPPGPVRSKAAVTVTAGKPPPSAPEVAPSSAEPAAASVPENSPGESSGGVRSQNKRSEKGAFR